MKNYTSNNIERFHPIIAASIAGILCLLLLGSGTYLYINPQLPNVEQLREIKLETPLQIYSRDGKLISEFGEKHSRPLHYDEIPPLLVKAFLAAEDDNFFNHKGISLKGLGRAFVDIAQTGSIQSGGSTITMQVAKNYFLSSQRTFSRKLTEILLARNIEQALSKEEILELYVNKIYLGQRAYGIGAAAEVYYSKNVNQLSLAEMAMIAGLPKAPSKYNPVVNPKRSLERRNWILGRMLSLGYIKQADYEQAIATGTGIYYRATVDEVSAPFLAEMVRAALTARFGDKVLGAGYRVYTTVRADIQNAAVRAVQDGLLAYDLRHGWRGIEAHADDKALNQFNIVGGLAPAQVTKVQRNSVEALMRDGTTITIPWGGLSWARPYKTVNSVGPSPSKASQILKVGDIIRVKKAGGIWVLRQIPNVQGDLIALNPETGAIEALVGGFDFSISQFNHSIQGWRQAGSTLKPFIYALALERGFTPYSMVNDSPLTVGNWTPSNADGRFMGPITLRRALYLSRNLVSVRLLQSVGVSRARTYLDRFGFINKELPDNLTLALGTAQVVPLQMATAYAAFANGGYRVNPYFIERIEDTTGKVLFQAQPEQVCQPCEMADNPAIENTQASLPTEITGEGNQINVVEPPVSDTTSDAITPLVSNSPIAKRIMSEKSAKQMANILRDVILHGTGRHALRLGRSDIAGKTGTTNDAKDAWFAGFNPKLVAVSWVGFDKPASLGRLEYGGYAALPLWTSFMDYALAGTPDKWLNENTESSTNRPVSSPTSETPPTNNSETPDTDTPSEVATPPVTPPEELF
ncbi:penicillin-binding protein 1A [Agitococcus lubricus]|uniref:Penicillin-binding protein 1A n=1 Tax=Agitococcus lubricus TaxID=1077255 RepID=A0A2T5J038_9GAMM|nr:penicillin-binding protein 1A [Agitococcus lubricus]PTQ89712.1 penicillin-binding protein 1A [Agitococcus lubricus]